MAVAAMAWVEGIPYSASVLISSLTTGGERGRGHFKMSLETWPMYITIWGEERPHGCQSAQAMPTQPASIYAFFPAKSTTPSADFILSIIKGVSIIPVSEGSSTTAPRCSLIRSGIKGGFTDEMQQYRHEMDSWVTTPHPLQPLSCETNSYKRSFSATTFKSLPCPAPRSRSPRAAPALLFPAAPTPPTAPDAAGTQPGCATTVGIK